MKTIVLFFILLLFQACTEKLEKLANNELLHNVAEASWVETHAGSKRVTECRECKEELRELKDSGGLYGNCVITSLRERNLSKRVVLECPL